MLCLLFASSLAACPNGTVTARNGDCIKIPVRKKFDVLDLVRSGALNSTSISPGCSQDMQAAVADSALTSASDKVNSDSYSLGVDAGMDCAYVEKPCGDHECCTVDLDWKGHSTDLADLQSLAKAVEANAHMSKLCIANETETATSGLTVVDVTIGHGGFFLIGKRCTPADLNAIMQATSATACTSPVLSNCHFFRSSPSCGGAPGACTEWNTMSEFWPLCDNPSMGTSWSVDLDAWIGPECSSATDEQCCYEPLGCKCC